jgi:hypothetical protein
MGPVLWMFGEMKIYISQQLSHLDDHGGGVKNILQLVT